MAAETIKTFNSFPAAARDFFGLQQGQSLKDFMAEISQLSPDDRVELSKGMSDHGIIINTR